MQKRSRGIIYLFFFFDNRIAKLCSALQNQYQYVIKCAGLHVHPDTSIHTPTQKPTRSHSQRASRAGPRRAQPFKHIVPTLILSL